jgi:hypothetical protein
VPSPVEGGEINPARTQRLRLVREAAERDENVAAERGFAPNAKEVRKLWAPKPSESTRATASLSGRSDFTASESRRGRFVVPQGVIDATRAWASQQIIATTGMEEEDINGLKMLTSSSSRTESPFAIRARVLIEEGIVTPGATLKDVVARTNERAKIHRARISQIVQELDTHMAAHPDEQARPPDGATIAHRIRTEVISELMEPADSELIQRLERDAAFIEAKGPMTYAKAQELKRSYDKWVDFTIEQEPLEESLKKVRQIVNSETDEKAEAMLAEIDPQKHGDFKDAKQRYSNLMRTKEVAEAAAVADNTQRNRDTSNRLAQFAAAGIAAGIGWLLGIILGIDPRIMATAAGSGGAASMGIKAVSSALGNLSPGVVAPWVYKATNRLQRNRLALTQAATQ